MVTKSAFSNWMVDAYLEGRLDEIPEDVLPVVKDIAERRNSNSFAANIPVEVTVEGEPLTVEVPLRVNTAIERPADASDEPAPRGWESVE